MSGLTKAARLPFLLFLCCALIVIDRAPAQQPQVLGAVTARVHLERGASLPKPVHVTLQSHGAPVGSGYLDSQGSITFNRLPPGPYELVIDDESYLRIERTAVINPEPLAPQVVLDITLSPRSLPAAKEPNRISGANSSITDVREYIKEYPKSAVREFDKAVSADAQGDVDRAIEHYQKAIQIAPDFYAARNNMGSDFLKKNDLLQAQKQFEQVVRLNQSDAAGYFNLANVSTLSGNLVDAHRYLQQGMRLEPNSALGHFLLGSLNMRQGNYDQAEAALRRAIQTSPEMTQAHLQLVNLLLRLGRQSEAGNELRAFVSAFPNSPFTPKARQLLQKLSDALEPHSAPN